MAGSKHPNYYQEFILVNAIAVLFMLCYLIVTVLDKRFNRENLVFVLNFSLLCVAM